MTNPAGYCRNLPGATPKTIFEIIGGSMNPTRVLLTALLAGGFLLAGGTYAENSTTDLTLQAPPPHQIAASNNHDTVTPTDKQPPQRERLKLALFICISFLTALFFMVLIISVIRMGRLQRRRLQIGKKSEPTEYVDAWSRYRLKNEPSENTGPSAKDQD
jgi:hypothetical protein